MAEQVSSQPTNLSVSTVSTSVSSVTSLDSLLTHSVPFPDISLTENQKQTVNMVHFIYQPVLSQLMLKIDDCLDTIKEQSHIIVKMTEHKTEKKKPLKSLKRKQTSQKAESTSKSDDSDDENEHAHRDTKHSNKAKKLKSNVHVSVSGEPIVVQLPLLLKNKVKKQIFYGLVTKVKKVNDSFFALTFVPLDNSLFTPELTWCSWSSDELNKKMREHGLRSQTVRPASLGSLFQGNTTIRNPYFCWKFATKDTPITGWSLDQCRRANITWKKATKVAAITPVTT